MCTDICFTYINTCKSRSIYCDTTYLKKMNRGVFTIKTTKWKQLHDACVSCRYTDGTCLIHVSLHVRYILAYLCRNKGIRKRQVF